MAFFIQRSSFTEKSAWRLVDSTLALRVESPPFSGELAAPTRELGPTAATLLLTTLSA